MIEAGLAEFAEYGIAGARVDRIATRAGCSAGLVYTHFGSKEDLFQAVYGFIVEQVVAGSPITAEDLPGYAGALFEAQQDNPAIMRLVAWHRLEAKEGELLDVVLKANGDKAERIRQAQEAGRISDRYPPGELLLLVIAVASLWSHSTDAELRQLGPATRDERRALVEKVIRDLVEPR
ncbi:TetR family transcriptional regulator [Crossiella sp. CA198]|uniref:TetR family transcriptional regulator n=1 Tax=Crossiella sp. CA198 TaxID=3455607 RepID=UPI003F8D4D33